MKLMLYVWDPGVRRRFAAGRILDWADLPLGAKAVSAFAINSVGGWRCI